MPDRELKTLSSTEVPALMGASPYKTRWTVMQRFMGNETATAGHNYMDWGLLLQPKVLERAAAELALEIEPNTLDTYTRRNLLGCTADAWTRAPDKGRGAVECKCIFNPHVWMNDWAGGKRVPKHVEIQHQVQLYCGDGTSPFPWGIIVAWYQAELHYFNREPIPDLWAEFESEAQQFFADLQAGNAGKPFGSAVELPLINQLFQVVEGKVLDLTHDPLGEALAQDAATLLDFAANRKFAQKNEDVCKAHLRAAIEDAETLRLPHGVVVRAKRISKKAHQVKATSYTQLDVFVPDAFDTPTTMLADNALAGG
jgi:hypothetical protein